MSVSDRRMFCLIWWFGGGGMGDEGGAEAVGWECLDLEWLEREEEADDDETLEEDLLSDALSFCCGCFLGIVKLDFVTLNAPVTWMGPGGKGDEGCTGDAPGFLDFAELLLGGVTDFLDDFDLELWEEVFLSFGEVLAALVAGAFLLPLAEAPDVEEDFSAGFWDAASFSFSFCSFSLCFSSLGGAGNRQETSNIFFKKCDRLTK